MKNFFTNVKPGEGRLYAELRDFKLSLKYLFFKNM